MDTPERKTLRSWMVLYAAFVAIALTNQASDPDYSEVETLSPVVPGADFPALTTDKLVRRSDI
ncbi:MAG: hypothetical protein KJO01_05420 [Gammaproteobacteria bacterium]|nr:hypothetical protein [Gammaproteobacteria bacterium]MBT8109278.1 hypothetical protein [Gammaproteobacteria bacterium]NND47751.1 hypothetical protein [Woeseiaceae bacterium]NNL43980.1 hypothetical protein [Woeseiaceae bacterium]